MDTNTSTDEHIRPAHDAIVARIYAEIDGRAVHLLVGATEHVLTGLFAALHAVDSTRYTVEPAERRRGYNVVDTWDPARRPIGWCSGRVQADRLAVEQNTFNADDAANELATHLDTTVAV